MKKTTILCVMAALCQKKRKGKRLKLKAFLALMLCYFLFAVQSSTAQELKPFKIGEKLPESFWQQEHDFYTDGKLKRQNLSAYKGKTLILDFFATWCPACMKSMGKMDVLSKTYKGKFEFLPISAKNTGDNTEKITALAKNLKTAVLNTSLVNDSLLNRYFPHRSIPTYVWIDEKGVLQALSNSVFLHQGNIDALLDKQNGSKLTNSTPKKQGK